MNCFNCGSQVQGEHKTCPYCGKSLQIVPDYSAFDEEDINILMEETPVAPKPQSKPAPKRPTERENERIRARKQREKQRALERKKKIQLIIVILSVIAICGMLFAAFFVVSDMIEKNNAGSVNYQVNQAESALKAGNYKLAEEYYLKAVKLDPSDIDIRFAIADMYKQAKNTEKMLDAYYDVLELDSQNYVAYKALYQYYNSQNDVEAILELRKGVTDSRVLGLFEDYAVESPKIYVKGGTYQGAIDVMVSAKLNYEIYYTIDGSDPTVNGIKYTGTIKINQLGMVTLKVAAKNEKGVFSNIVSETYYLQFDAPADPVLIPGEGTYDVQTYITVFVPTGCTAYYTWDRSDPRLEDSYTRFKYEEPLLIPSGSNVFKLVVIDDTTGLASSLYTGMYTCTVEGIPVPQPVIPDTETPADTDTTTTPQE